MVYQALLVAGRSVGVNFVLGGDKFSDTRVDLILDLKKNDFFFLEKTYNGKVIFTTGNGHSPQEKQYFLSFVGFCCPQKPSKIVSRNLQKLVPSGSATLKIPL